MRDSSSGGYPPPKRSLAQTRGQRLVGLRQRFEVLGPVGELLRSDDVTECSESHDDVADDLGNIPRVQLGEARATAIAIAVPAGRTDKRQSPRRIAELPQRLRVRLEREAVDLIVCRTADSQLRVNPLAVTRRACPRRTAVR